MTVRWENPLAIYRKLNPPIYVLFVATMINGIGIFVYPFLALYLTKRLGYSALEAGTFMTIASTLYVPGSFIGSKLADIVGRKPIMVIAQLLMDGCFILCGFWEGSAIVPFLILLALFFDGAVDPAREALKIDVTTIEDRQVSFSLLYLGHNLGYAFGPVIAGYLFYANPRWLFWGNGLAGILSTLLVMWKIKETKPSRETLKESLEWKTTEKGEQGGILKALLTRPKLLLFALFLTFFSYAYSQTLFALPLLTTDLFGMKGAPLYGKMMALNGLVVVLFTPLLVSKLRRFHPLANTVVAGLLYATAFSLFAFATLPASFLLLTAVFTMGEIISATNEHFYIANNTPISHRARFSAILPIIMGTGHAVAPLIGGAIIASHSMNLLWISTGVSALLGSLGVFGIYLYEKRQQRQAGKP
ncbi:MFS transporter [Sphaerochaeta sp. PS]|uniref:MFS transporter n=1 Tax=Sphaerochaeta sp. PS TaxID=3076336 RepID=UPI0028A3706B|nr:MFS transporter [Sphaerochaeta sp. PS]MDT4763203.1 MFS transporter [Sphaerochaeta sp. PS]